MRAPAAHLWRRTTRRQPADHPWGGLGIVEGHAHESPAPVAFGGVSSRRLPQVLCYRIVSFWGFLPVGWITWGALAIHNRRLERVAVAAAEIALISGVDIKALHTLESTAPRSATSGRAEPGRWRG